MMNLNLCSIKVNSSYILNVRFEMICTRCHNGIMSGFYSVILFCVNHQSLSNMFHLVPSKFTIFFHISDAQTVTVFTGYCFMRDVQLNSHYKCLRDVEIQSGI